MMDPCAAAKCGRHSRIQAKASTVQFEKARSRSSSRVALKSSARATSEQFTSTSMRPKRSTISCVALRTAGVSSCATRNAMTSAPVSSASDRAKSFTLACGPTATILAPCTAKPTAMACAMLACASHPRTITVLSENVLITLPYLQSCQNATALAAATLSESTPCAIGMRTV